MAKTTAKSTQISDIDLQDSLINIKNALLDATDDVKGRGVELITELLNNIRNRKEDYQNDLEDIIAEKPFKSVGAALLIGFLTAKFIL